METRSGVCRPRNQCPTVSRRGGSDTWSKLGELRGRGVAQNVGLGSMPETALHGCGTNNTVGKESEGWHY